MTQIVLDKGAVSLLDRADHRVEIRDESGRLVGYFDPAGDETDAVEVPFTDEELRRFAAEPGGRSLAEILGRLRGEP